ncbi:unnamed protein product, partial [Rotaria sordida]
EKQYLIQVKTIVDNIINKSIQLIHTINNKVRDRINKMILEIIRLFYANQRLLFHQTKRSRINRITQDAFDDRVSVPTGA